MTAPTLTEFLLARIAEDEADLRESRISDMPEWWAPDAWSRDRGLAECEAKRRIVAAHPIVSTDLGKGREGYIGFGCETCHAFDGAVSDGGYCDTMLALATIYADHPDCDEAWRP